MIPDSEIDDLANEMRNDAKIEAWENPESALQHYAQILRTYKECGCNE